MGRFDTSRGLRLFIVGCLVAGAILPASGQVAATGTIVGEVVMADGRAVTDAEVTLVGARRRVQAGSDGSFRIEGLAPGTYLLEVESPSFGHGHLRVEVTAEAEARARIVLDVTSLHDEVVVTAGASPQQQLDMAQATTVLAGEELDQRRDTSLGETLAAQPGVSSTYFGPGASRPVIRGLGGDRVRMLTGGLGSADASNVSPDHAVSIDPLSADRVEILRGPSTLLYGSTAIGGVVNVLDDRIPEYRADAPLSGSLDLYAGSVSDERSGALSLSGGAASFAWHADYLKRETDDTEIPGFAEADPHPGEKATGVLENSALTTESGSVGFSLVGDRGLVGVAVSGFDTLYGVPGHEHEEGEAGVSIDLEQRRVDLRAELSQSLGPFSTLKLRLGSADYEHVELEGEEIGTTFKNNALEGRFELVQKKTDKLSGSLGLQVATSDFEAIGEEAFVPPSTTDLLALFFFEELHLGAVRLELGGRYERQDIEVAGEDPGRDLSGLSGSFGAVWTLFDSWSLSGSLARSVRLPTATERYANGPHVATGAFEIGNPDLAKEVSTGLDLSLRKTAGRLTATVSLFANRFDDYVFERFTGEEEDGLAVIAFAQEDAEFVGGELEGLISLYRGADSHLDLALGFDAVRARLRESGEPLPRIPPRRSKLGLTFHHQRLRAYAEVVRAEKQDRTSAHETPTAGYTLVSAGVSYRFYLGPTVFDVSLRGRNLTDEEARNHVSFLKDVAPLPGRDIGLAVRVSF